MSLAVLFFFFLCFFFNDTATTEIYTLSLQTLFRSATQAHLDAVNAVDGQLLTPLANHEAVTVAIAKLIASAPPAKIKAVFDTVPNVQGLNFDWFSTMSVPDAVKSYQAFLETAAAVKAR